MHVKEESRKKVSVNNGQLCFHLPPRVEHASHLDEKKSVLTKARPLDQITQNNAVHGDMKKGKFGKFLLNKISTKKLISNKSHENKIETK